jgi:outer membrane protein OmpA-like peptidoglycan-associated protein
MSSTALAAGVLTSISLLAASPAGAVALLPSGTNVVGTCVSAPVGGSNYTGALPISQAVAATTSGGTVYICPGTWADNVTVTVPMTIEGSGQASTTVEPANSDPLGYDNTTNQFNSTVFLVQADNVTIENLTINGSNASAVTTSPWTPGSPCDNTWAAYGEDGGCAGVTINAGAGIDTGIPASAVTGMSVEDVTVENVYSNGIANRSYDGTFSFSNDTVTNVGGTGAGIFTYESNGSMTDDTVSWAGVGIQTNWGAVTATGNTIKHSNWGFFMGNIGEPAGYADGGSTTISDNAVGACWGQSLAAGASTGDYELGIAFFAPFAPTAETASNNSITGCSTGLADFSSNNDEPGTYATPVVTFSNNTLNGQGALGGIGALVTTDKLGYNIGPVDAQFTKNVISNFPTALYTDETSLNNLAGAGDAALPGGLTVTASGNQFDGGWYNDATGTISAANNWWGFATGPVVTIGNPPDPESPAALISRAAPTWWDTPNGTPTAPRNVLASAGNGQATVKWTAPVYTGNTNPSVTVSYAVTASPGGKTCSTAALSCTVTGLTNGTSYTFTVTPRNALGSGPGATSPARVPTGLVTISPFGYRLSGLTSALKTQIKALAQLVKKDGFTDVGLAGYTNPGEVQGSPVRLGLDRASSVATYLLSQLNSLGVTGVTFSETYGGTATVAPRGSAANRRVVVSISY